MKEDFSIHIPESNLMLISLTHGKFTIVEPQDYAFLMQWKWFYHGSYAARTHHIDRTNNKCRTIFMHRVILERMGHKNFTASDHKNRNKLDNRRYNLRPATDSQSQCNRNKQSNNTSGYTGVYWNRGKWRADVRVNKKHIYLGRYNNPKEAAKAYNKAAIKYHGEFAVLNKI